MNKKNKILLLTFFILFSALYAKNNEEVTLKKIKLQLKWTHQFQFAGYYAAVEKGFYKDAGFDVQLIPAPVGIDALKELINGNADYAVYNSTALIYYLKGQPIVVLGAIFQHSPSILLTKKNSNITSAQDLFGKKIALSKGVYSAEIIAMLNAEGINKEDYQFINMSKDVDANITKFIHNKVDAIQSYSIDNLYRFRTKGIDCNEIYPHRYGIDFYGDCLFTTVNKIRQNIEEVEKFREATFKGWEYAMSHTEEMVKITHNKYATELEENFLRFEAENIQDLIIPNYVKIGMMNPGRWKSIAEVYSSMGYVNSTNNIGDFIYDKDVFKYYKWLDWIIVFLSVGLLLLLLVFFWIFQLKRSVNLRTKELRENEIKYQTVVENASDGILIFQEERIKFANKKALEMSGYTKENIYNIDFVDLITDDYRDLVLETYKKRIKREKVPSIYEIKLKRKNGEIKEVELNSALIKYEDKDSILVLVRNIAERKKTEKALIEAERKAKESEELKTDFLAQVSHEIRTPINTIMSFLSLIEEDVRDKLSKELEESFFMIYNSGRRIIRTIDLILNMSQISNRVYQPIYSKINLCNKILKSLIMEYTKRGAKKGIEIKENIQEENIEVWADEYTVMQIFDNLLDNAFKYTNKGKIELRLVVDENFITVIVEDTGIGIEKKYFENLFKPFSQEKQGYTRKYEGNGLGLALVKGYCEVNKANIEIESKKYVGTKVKVIFNRNITLEELQKL